MKPVQAKHEQLMAEWDEFVAADEAERAAEEEAHQYETGAEGAIRRAVGDGLGGPSDGAHAPGTARTRPKVRVDAHARAPAPAAARRRRGSRS